MDISRCTCDFFTHNHPRPDCPEHGNQVPTARRYRKTALVEAMQWTGDNLPELLAWSGGDRVQAHAVPGAALIVRTLEGELRCEVGDWVLRGPEGECWPVRGDIFARTYEPVDGAA